MKSLERKVIIDHLNRFPGEPDPGKKRDWIKHIKRAINNMKKELKHLKGKTREEWAQKIKDYEAQVEKLSKGL